MADLDTLRPEVREAVKMMDVRVSHATWQPIRAELLRLADENARLRERVSDTEHFRDVHLRAAGIFRQRAEKAEAELAALKARIAEAPVVACPKTLVHAGNPMQTEFLEYTHERMPGGCNSWAGKRVRLVVEE